MDMKDAVLKLRKDMALSQDAFAEKLFVTRQAVSRWENGETFPGIDTLKLMAETFNVSIDHMLGNPAGICQSCGMPLMSEDDKGTEPDGAKSEEYCASCYQYGQFTQASTMEAQIEHNLQALDEWNRSVGLALTEREAREQLRAFLPTLKRWRT